MNFEKGSGERLRAWIERKGWTKREFARRVGIHEANVNKYLRNEVDIANLYAALVREGCDMYWLETGKERNPSEEAAILEVLRARGITTVAEVHQVLAAADKVRLLAAQMQQEFQVLGTVEDLGGTRKVPFLSSVTSGKGA